MAEVGVKNEDGAERDGSPGVDLPSLLHKVNHVTDIDGDIEEDEGEGEQGRGPPAVLLGVGRDPHELKQPALLDPLQLPAVPLNQRQELQLVYEVVVVSICRLKKIFQLPSSNNKRLILESVCSGINNCMNHMHKNLYHYLEIPLSASREIES